MTIVKIDRSCYEKLPFFPRLKVAYGSCKGWEACLDGRNADALAEYIADTKSYHKAVEAECKPKEAPNDPTQ